MKDPNRTFGQQDRRMSRRDFIGAATAVAAFTVVPGKVLGGSGNEPPSEKLNIAVIGVGGRGAEDNYGEDDHGPATVSLAHSPPQPPERDVVLRGRRVLRAALVEVVSVL